MLRPRLNASPRAIFLASHIAERHRPIRSRLRSGVGTPAIGLQIGLQAAAVFRSERLNQALAIAKRIVNYRDRVEALLTLLPHLMPNQRADAINAAVQAAKDIVNPWAKVAAITAIAPILSGRQRYLVFEEALKAAADVPEEAKGQTLGSIVAYLSKRQRDVAVNIAISIKDEYERADVLASDLAPYLLEKHLDQILDYTFAIENLEARVEGLQLLARHLTASQLAGAVERSLSMKDDIERWRAFAAFAPLLQGSRLKSVYSDLSKIEAPGFRALAISALLPNMRGRVRTKAVDEALFAARLAKSYPRFYAFAALVPQTQATIREGLVSEINSKLSGMHPEPCCSLVSYIAPHVPVEERTAMIGTALAAADKIEDEWLRWDHVMNLLPHMSVEQRDMVLKRIDTIANEMVLGKVLVEMMHLSKDTERIKLLRRAKSIVDDDTRGEAVFSAAVFLMPKYERQIIEILSGIGKADMRATALALTIRQYPLAPELLETARSAALAAVNSIEDTNLREQTYAIVAPQLAPEQRFPSIIRTFIGGSPQPIPGHIEAAPLGLETPAKSVGYYAYSGFEGIIAEATPRNDRILSALLEQLFDHVGISIMARPNAAAEIKQRLLELRNPEPQSRGGHRLEPPLRSPVRALSDGEVAALIAYGKKHSFEKRSDGDKRAPFEWVRDKYRRWYPGVLMHHLKAADFGLWQILHKRISRARKGQATVPDWFDVPTEEENRLRAATPEERVKIQELRRLGRKTRRLRAGLD